MKTIYLAPLSILVILVSCGSDPNKDVDCIDGCNGKHYSGYVEENEEEKLDIQVPPGAKGDKGEAGKSCTTYAVEDGAVIECEDGSQTFISNGTNGEDGQNGTNGEDGESCIATQLSSGAIIQCGSASIVIYNGVDGTNGTNGTNGVDGTSSIIEFIDPCGDNVGKFDEVLLRLATGEIIAYFEEGGSRYLSIIGPGNYQTTDKQKCDFTITPELDVIW